MHTPVQLLEMSDFILVLNLIIQFIHAVSLSYIYHTSIRYIIQPNDIKATSNKSVLLTVLLAYLFIDVLSANLQLPF